jgi:hypothetical protein
VEDGQQCFVGVLQEDGGGGRFDGWRAESCRFVGAKGVDLAEPAVRASVEPVQQAVGADRGDTRGALEAVEEEFVPCLPGPRVHRAHHFGAA